MDSYPDKISFQYFPWHFVNPWHFCDRCQIPSYFQVFQSSCHPDDTDTVQTGQLTELAVLAGELVAFDAAPLHVDGPLLLVCTVEAEKALRPRPPMKLSICNTPTQFRHVYTKNSLLGNFTTTTHAHTHICLMTLCTGLPGWTATRKVKPIWILLKQEKVNDSGISWAICKSAPRSRQITMPAPHHSVLYRPDALPAAQPTASKHWRQDNNNNNTNHDIVYGAVITTKVIAVHLMKADWVPSGQVNNEIKSIDLAVSPPKTGSYHPHLSIQQNNATSASHSLLLPPLSSSSKNIIFKENSDSIYNKNTSKQK